MKKAKEIEFYKLRHPSKSLFEDEIELLPSVTELFELELAYLEYHCLQKDELLERLAYFKSIDGELTKHYIMYGQAPEALEALTENRSATTKAYFRDGVFSTGYATHGLFPYRGKFHPQLIKAILNIIGIEKGDTVLDPMCGSGTMNIEASLMNINSHAVDLSPFCQFMTKVKYDSLSIEVESLIGLSNKSGELFDFFNSVLYKEKIDKISDINKRKIYDLALLAFLDSLGYSKRVVRANHKQLFEKVLKRYENTVVNFISKNGEYMDNLGEVNILESATATRIPLEANSIDGVITSPPYSFAVDYVQNDHSQLSFLGHDIDSLKNAMIGLAGRNKDERLEKYFEAMDGVCAEVARLLKRNKYFVLIIGSNTNQTGGIRLENKIIESCIKYGLELVKSILKPIKGMRNTMKDEYVLFFRKGDA